MLTNFLRMAFRHLGKRKGYSVLNILGLTAGIICCLLIFEYVAYERSFDTFHEKADRIVRVQDEEWQNGRMTVPCASATPALGPELKREFPEVEGFCRLLYTSCLVVNPARNVRARENKLYYSDAAVLDLFHLPLVKGDARTALSAPGR